MTDVSNADFATPRTPAAAIAGLDAGGRARAAEQAEMLASVGAGLSGLAYADRRAVLAHMTPALGARGLPAEAIASFDPTDANLAAVVGQARALGDHLATTNPAAAAP